MISQDIILLIEELTVVQKPVTSKDKPIVVKHVNQLGKQVGQAVAVPVKSIVAKPITENAAIDKLKEHKGKLIAGAALAGTAGAGTAAYKNSPHFANAVDKLGEDTKQVVKSDIVEPFKSLARRKGLISGTDADKRYDQHEDVLAKLRGDTSDEANALRIASKARKSFGDNKEDLGNVISNIGSRSKKYIDLLTNK